jgi:hypothetical protein
MAGASKVIKSGKMTPVTGGPSGKVGKQGGAKPAVPGKVSIPGNEKGGGKFGKGGGTGFVGKQKGSVPSKPGVSRSN